MFSASPEEPRVGVNDLGSAPVDSDVSYGDFPSSLRDGMERGTRDCRIVPRELIATMSLGFRSNTRPKARPENRIRFFPPPARNARDRTVLGRSRSLVAHELFPRYGSLIIRLLFAKIPLLFRAEIHQGHKVEHVFSNNTRTLFISRQLEQDKTQ